jgi:lipopolysaccharide transport system ATP-binding protein
MTPIIEVKGLSKKYQIGEQQPYLTLRDSLASLVKNPFKKIKEGLNKDEFWALKDINFTVEPGEVVGIIGRNGAGKSTLLKILSRITPPTSGEVILRGRVGSLLEVGTGFQQELTGRENIYLNGAILGMSQIEIKRKFDEIVAFAEVDKFIDTPVKHYSSGMYMRLAFSIAAHLDPEILIVDEVLAVGDAEFQKKCLGKMDEVSKKQGKTVLFVSHNINAIRHLCKKVILIENGKSIMGGKDVIIGQYLKNNEKNRDKNNSHNHISSLKVLVNSSPNCEVPVGGRVNISVELKMELRTKYQIAIEVINSLDENLFWLYPHKNVYTYENSIRVWNFTIENLNLYPGNYNIGIWIARSDKSEIIFRDRNISSITVHENLSIEYFPLFSESETKYIQKYSLSSKIKKNEK